MADQFDLNLLRVFDVVVEERSVTAASERLRLSIPATSRALNRLRRAVRDPVLVRAGRAMVPTPFALRIAPRVRSLLEEASVLVNAERAVRVADLERVFTLRINDGIASTLAAVVVEATSALAPGVVLSFVAEGAESADALRDGSVDLDIGVGGATAPDIRGEVLYRERMVGIAGARCELGPNPGLAELCRYPHVSASRRGRARGPLDDALEAAGLRRRVAALVPTHVAAALLVGSTDYIGLVPQRFARQHAQAFGIRWFPVPAPLPEVEVCQYWHVRLDTDPAQRWLRETIVGALAGR
ncbi:LysR family transcriptional regulator [Nocardia alba]|uniref:DNA-binding transcriptional LysR family regulator n=1 Tax=Nocardia alba TaxID=225051 RepID=A0A4R1FUL0_9NOCA|nr:LysR family transcriptional regulator [Nocardia alba]TCJ97542.1 DNA-binding transcriptional LysR family regulator [Nocardia alba]